MEQQFLTKKSFLFDVNDPFFADITSGPLPKWQCLKKGIQSFKEPTRGNSPERRRATKGYLYQEGMLRFSNLKERHIKWVRANIPSARISFEKVPGGGFMRNYSGYSKYVTFANKADAMLFKLAWWR